MARGSSYGDQPPLHELPATTQVPIRRATRILPEVHVEEQELDTYTDTYGEDEEWEERLPARRTTVTLPEYHKPLARHRMWLLPLVLSTVAIVIILGVAISAGSYQRPSAGHLVPYQGQTFSIQVGGSMNALNQWVNSNGPAPVVAKTPIPTSSGPYSVLGKPTISAAFINQVLSSYGSPAAGLGQQMYDLGVKYGIDPVYALAFFQHESSFGTTGEARVTLSLGNLRCITTRPCIDQNRGGYAQMYSWTDGFEQWYKLIRNLYVAQWGRVTVDQIIPKYAPNSDGNNEAEYIAALKHSVDAWRAGVLRP